MRPGYYCFFQMKSEVQRGRVTYPELPSARQSWDCGWRPMVFQRLMGSLFAERMKQWLLERKPGMDP